MRYLFPKNFTGIFLIFSILQYEASYSRNSAYANSLNSSNEISNIFSLPHKNSPVSNGAPGTGNFAEGGLINENLTQSLTRTSFKNFHKNFSGHVNFPEKQNKKPYLHNGDAKNMSGDVFETSTLKNLLRTKLTETGSNLFLGVPEVIHVNGTSSIKPRKGVQYSETVPRKGVDNENGLSGNESCFWLDENKCYNAKAVKNLKCICCKESNALGKAIEEQASEDCKNCNPVNSPLENKQTCQNICCDLILHDIHSLSNYLNYQTTPSIAKDFHSSHEISGKVETSSVFLKKTNAEEKDVFTSSKNSKLKPSVTKVPYDVEIVTNLLGNSQQKVFVLIVVSLFLLPLIGILIFFLWRRAKEYWDKRYYKRMDFLIDGIYND